MYFLIHLCIAFLVETEDFLEPTVQATFLGNSSVTTDSTACALVTIVDDDVYEETEEMFTLIIASFSINTTVTGAIPLQSVIIEDDECKYTCQYNNYYEVQVYLLLFNGDKLIIILDCFCLSLVAEFSVTMMSVYVLEDDGFVEVCARLTGPLGGTAVSLQVGADTANGTALGKN